MIHVVGLTYSYPASQQPALEDLNLHIPKGQFCGVVGANGSGKSTLCYVLSGFVPHLFGGALHGKVKVAGIDVSTNPPSELAGRVGLVFDNPFNQITGARFTVREEVAFGMENLGVPRGDMLDRIEAALAHTGLSHLSDRSPFSLSGGEQQRLAIASILVLRPEVLVLDEPTSQLDPSGAKQVFETLAALAVKTEITVVMVEHKVDRLASFADRVIALRDGRIIADGEPDEILASDELSAMGVDQTSFTQAAREARARMLVPKRRKLPVTLEQAIAYFR